jgi:hypothetical protein
MESSTTLLSEILYEDIREVLLRLNPEQTRYVFHRVTSRTDTEAAKKTGVTPSTVAGWRKTIPDVELAIRILLLKPLESALSRLEQAALQAANTLVELLDSESDKMRLQAANSIFKHLGVGSTKYLEVRGQVKVQPDIPDDALLERAYQVMERQGHLIEGEIVSDGSVVA